MQFQALILSSIILISVFLTQAADKNAETTDETTDKPFFIKEVSLSVSGKANNFKKELSKKSDLALEEANEAKIILEKNLAEAGSVVNYNWKNFLLSSVPEEANAITEKTEIPEARVSRENPENSGDEEFFLLENPAVFQNNSNECLLKIKSSFDGYVASVKYLNYNLDVFELNADKRWPIASLTKLMTSAVAAENINPQERIILTDKAVATEGNAGDLEAGEIFESGDLIKSMMMVSSNDAAAALAEFFGEKKFIDAMQKKAKELNMFQTAFAEPTGLSFVNQSTVSDLNKLLSYIYRAHPEILEISRTKETEITELNSGKKKKLLNINQFAGRENFIGGKTGYTEEAGRNLAAVFEIKGQPVLSIVLGTNDSFKETNKILECL